jgi:hypothetical protein
MWQSESRDRFPRLLPRKPKPIRLDPVPSTCTTVSPHATYPVPRVTIGTLRGHLAFVITSRPSGASACVCDYLCPFHLDLRSGRLLRGAEPARSPQSTGTAEIQPKTSLLGDEGFQALPRSCDLSSDAGTAGSTARFDALQRALTAHEARRNSYEIQSPRPLATLRPNQGAAFQT